MARARANQVDDRAALDVEQDPDHRLANFIDVNGTRMRAVFASPREQAECLLVLARPWNADGRMHPLITKLHEYNPERYTLDVLGYPVVVEFESADEARTGLAAYLTEDEIAGKPARTRRARPAPAAPAPGVDARTIHDAPAGQGGGVQGDAFARVGDGAGGPGEDAEREGAPGA